MSGIINGVDFHSLETQKYWTFPSGYKKDAKAETRNMIFSGDYTGARKMDGVFYKFIKDSEGNIELIGRSKSVSGDYLNKINWVPQLHDFFNSTPNGSCFLGEIFFPDNEGSSNVTTITGCAVDKALARQEKGKKLYYYIFDVLAYDNEVLYKDSIEKRITYLDKIEPTEYVMKATYYDGEELWDKLQEILISGGEGVVITRKDSCYQPGKRPARQTLKIKKEIQQTIDCLFTGKASQPTREYTGKEIKTWKYWENLQTGEKVEGEFYNEYSKGASIEPVTKPYFFNWAGSLEIGLVKEDKVIPIGYLSGLTDEIKSNPNAQKGKIIEVNCMEILPTGGLRHAKLVRFRPELTLEDATWEKVFGNEG